MTETEAASRTSARAVSATQAEAEAEAEEEPKLCPDLGPDAPHGASERAQSYQELISASNNPQGRLPAGLAVSLINPATGEPVVFDDCRESDGTMIEAKGPGFAKLLRNERLRLVSPRSGPIKRKTRWTRAAGGLSNGISRRKRRRIRHARFSTNMTM